VQRLRYTIAITPSAKKNSANASDKDLPLIRASL